MNRHPVQHLVPSLISLTCLSSLISCSPKLEEYKKGAITAPVTIGIRNLSEVEIVPDRTPVEIDWKGFNTLSGGGLDPGFEGILISDSVNSFLITDRGMGNGRLRVNGEIYRFDWHSQHVRIQFGVGISIVSGSDHQHAKHVYDIDLPSPKM